MLLAKSSWWAHLDWITIIKLQRCKRLNQVGEVCSLVLIIIILLLNIPIHQISFTSEEIDCLFLHENHVFKLVYPFFKLFSLVVWVLLHHFLPIRQRIDHVFFLLEKFIFQFVNSSIDHQPVVLQTYLPMWTLSIMMVCMIMLVIVCLWLLVVYPVV